MIKAVIFDWGGVLIDDPQPPMIAYFSKKLEVSQMAYYKVYRNIQFDWQMGKLNEMEFWEYMCMRLGSDFPEENSLWKEAFEQVYKEKYEIFRLVKNLKSNGMLTGCLTNTEIPGMEFFKSKNYGCFDEVVYSCEEGYIKPGHIIYDIMLKRLGVKAKECIFIDDIKNNVKAARRRGFWGILFEDPRQVSDDVYMLIEDNLLK